jgi:hypothetical protein
MIVERRLSVYISHILRVTRSTRMRWNECVGLVRVCLWCEFGMFIGVWICVGLCLLMCVWAYIMYVGVDVCVGVLRYLGLCVGVCVGLCDVCGSGCLC